MPLHHLKTEFDKIIIIEGNFLNKIKYSHKPINHKTKSTFREKSKVGYIKTESLLKASVVYCIFRDWNKNKNIRLYDPLL